MKALGRGHVWWPKMDRMIEEKALKCVECLENRSNPAKAPVHHWEKPSAAWTRLHIDYAGPFMGRMFLIISDAYSKWVDIYPTKGCTSAETIEKLRHSIAIQGKPLTIVSDNGRCFTSGEFAEFCKKNSLRHVTSAPYHPSTNGLAERNVQTFKGALKKWKLNGETIETKVERYLYAYRNTPHSVTGVSPAELILKKKPRTALR